MALDLRLDGRSCIVTGAAQGIGAAEASLLARRGASVLCVDRSDPSPTVSAICGAGGRAIGWQGDVAVPGAAEAVLVAAGDLKDPLAVLVNNAGVVRDHMIFNVSDEDWESVVAVNLTASFRLCRAVARHWRQSEPSLPRRIINTTSESGLYGNAGQANYAAAKAGVVGLSLTLAAELVRYGVGVNAVAPRARTPMSEAAFGQDTDDALSPSYVAAVVAWLASEAADGITGQVFVVAGRQVARLGGWSPIYRSTQPASWGSTDADRLRNELFPRGDGRHVPAPIAELFAARSTGGRP